MLTEQDFLDRFPNFDTTQVNDKWPVLSKIWPCYYPNTDYGIDDCDDEAILNLVAHLFVTEISQSDAAFKDIQSQSVGSVSVSYNNNGSNISKEFFNSTKYGQRFLQLIRARQGAVFT